MIAVHDDVLEDAAAYRQIALTQPYETVAGFHGIAPPPDTSLEDWLAVEYPTLTPVWSFLRRSPRDQVEPHYIHHDRMMGDWTAIYYLHPDPPAGDGTKWWRNRQTGATAAASPTDASADYDEAVEWECYQHVDARWNRLVLFPAGWFHSRAIPENYGTTPDTARLTHVVFLQGSV